MSWSRYRLDYSRRRGFAVSLFIMGFLVLTAVAPVQGAGHRSWLAAAVEGEVYRFVEFSSAWRQVVVGDKFAPGTRVRTGSGSRLTLIRGRDTVVVHPDSEFMLTGDVDNPPDSIFQSLGRMLFEVENRESRSFSVETPLLASTVKGTRFVVAVSPVESSVAVESGTVEVTARATGETVLLTPGMTATVSAQDNELEVTALDPATTTDPVGDVVDTATDTVGGAVDAAGNAVGAAGNTVGGAAATAKDTVDGASAVTRDAVTGAGGLLK